MKLLLLFGALLALSSVGSAQSKYSLTDEQEAYVAKQESALQARLQASIQQDRARKKFAYPAANRPALRRDLDVAIQQLGFDPSLFVLTDAAKVAGGEARAALRDGYVYISTRTMTVRPEELPFTLAHEYAHVLLEHPMRLATTSYRMAAMYCFKCVKGKDPVDVVLEFLERGQDAYNVISRKYELDADSWAVHHLSKQGVYLDYLALFSDPKYGCLAIEEDTHPSCKERARNAYYIIGMNYQHLLTNDTERMKVFQTGAFTVE